MCAHPEKDWELTDRELQQSCASKVKHLLLSALPKTSIPVSPTNWVLSLGSRQCCYGLYFTVYRMNCNAAPFESPIFTWQMNAKANICYHIEIENRPENGASVSDSYCISIMVSVHLCAWKLLIAAKLYMIHWVQKTCEGSKPVLDLNCYYPRTWSFYCTYSITRLLDCF